MCRTASQVSDRRVRRSMLGCVSTLHKTRCLTARGTKGFLSGPARRKSFSVPRVSQRVRVGMLNGTVPSVVPRSFHRRCKLVRHTRTFVTVRSPISHGGFSGTLRALQCRRTLVYRATLIGSHSTSHGSGTATYPRAQLGSSFVTSLPFTLAGNRRRIVTSVSTSVTRSCPVRQLLRNRINSNGAIITITTVVRTIKSNNRTILMTPARILTRRRCTDVSAVMSGLKGDSTGSDSGRGGLSSTGTQQDGGQSTRDSGSKRFSTGAVRGGTISGNMRLTSLLSLTTSSSIRAKFSNGKGSVFNAGSKRVPMFLLAKDVQLTRHHHILTTTTSNVPYVIITSRTTFSGDFRTPGLALTIVSRRRHFNIRRHRSLGSGNSATPRLLIVATAPVPHATTVA